MICETWRLSQIPEVKESVNHDEELAWNPTSDDTYDIALNSAVISPSDLLQL